jgi:hypothetical protein
MIRLIALALLASLTIASAASAQFGPDTLVGGDLEIDVEVGDVETKAVGGCKNQGGLGF